MKTVFLHRVLLIVACLFFGAMPTLVAQDDSNETSSKKTKIERAEEKRLNGVWKTSIPVPGFEEIDLWKGIEAGEVEVIYRTVDAYNANITVKNKSDRHLAIKMPAAFASVPVLRQGLGMGGMGGGMGGMGGGMGGMGGMGGGMGGMFNIPPGRDGMVAVKTLCIEHGNTDPTPKSKYTMRPLDEYVKDPRMAAIVSLLANDQVDHAVAQAAVWNMYNNVSWDELLKKNRIELMDGYTEKFFHPTHIAAAQKLVAVIEAEVGKSNESRANVSHEAPSRAIKN